MDEFTIVDQDDEHYTYFTLAIHDEKPVKLGIRFDCTLANEVLKMSLVFCSTLLYDTDNITDEEAAWLAVWDLPEWLPTFTKYRQCAYTWVSSGPVSPEVVEQGFMEGYLSTALDSVFQWMPTVVRKEEMVCLMAVQSVALVELRTWESEGKELS